MFPCQGLEGRSGLLACAASIQVVLEENFLSSSFLPEAHVSPRHSWLRPVGVCVICALFDWGGKIAAAPITLYLSHLRTEAKAGQLLAEEPNVPRRIIRVSNRKIIHCLKAALSSKQAYGTCPVL